MKEGMQKGQTASVTLTVTKDMFAQFEGDVVHPTYSTVSMVYHMEWASRQIILPFLEDNEEGMGGAVSIKHLKPALEGSTVIVKATLTRFTNQIVLTKVEAKSDKGIIGIGEVKQVILPKTKIKEMLAIR